MMAPQRQDSFFELHKAANLYGNIPQELSTDFRATGTGAPKTIDPKGTVNRSAARPEVKFGFIPRTDPRLNPEMKAEFLQVGYLRVGNERLIRHLHRTDRNRREGCSAGISVNGGYNDGHSREKTANG